MRTLLEDIVQEIELPARARRALAFVSPIEYERLEARLASATLHLSKAQEATIRARAWQEVFHHFDKHPGLSQIEYARLAEDVIERHLDTLRQDPRETLAQWKAEEAIAVQQIKAGVGRGKPSARHLADRSGYEGLQALMRGTLPSPAIADEMGLCMVILESGRVVFQGTPSPRFLNPMGAVHGGWMSTLLLSALSATLQSTLTSNASCMAAEQRVRYLRGLSLRVERVRASGRVVARQGRYATVSGQLYGPDGTIYADATAEFLVLGESA